jgi:hypothetical protein
MPVNMINDPALFSKHNRRISKFRFIDILIMFYRFKRAVEASNQCRPSTSLAAVIYNLCSQCPLHKQWFCNAKRPFFSE